MTDIWGREKPELAHKNFKEGGDHEGGKHEQKFVILMVKMKEFFSWGVPKVLPQPTGLHLIYTCLNFNTTMINVYKFYGLQKSYSKF